MASHRRENRVDEETDRRLTRLMMWVGVVGVAVTLVLEYLGVFHDWGIILTVVFGLIGVAAFMKGATRESIGAVLVRLNVLARGQELTNARLDQTNARLDQANARLDQTNATLSRMASTLERIEGKIPGPPLV